MRSMQKRYGAKAGKRVFYATENKQKSRAKRKRKKRTAK